MTSTERKVTEFLEKNLYVLFILVVTVLSVPARKFGMDYVSRDMSVYLLKWMESFRATGFHTLAEQVGNYNIPYQVILTVLGKIPIQDMYLIKYVSIAFDYILAVSAAICVRMLVDDKDNKSKLYAAIAYAVVIFSPAVIINSSMWGQCDSIFSAFAVISAAAFVKKRYTISMFALGVSFAFKLQALFMLPAYVIAYFVEKKYSIWKFIMIPAALYVLSLPALLLGRSFLDPIRIYLEQYDYNNEITLNFVSFWNMLCGQRYNPTEFTDMKLTAVLITLIIFGIALLSAMHYGLKLEKPQGFMNLCVWSLWTCMLFLPSMLSRYAYPMDILLIILVFLDWKVLPEAILANAMSISMIGRNMFGFEPPYFALAVIYLLGYCLFTWHIVRTAEYTKR